MECLPGWDTSPVRFPVTGGDCGLMWGDVTGTWRWGWLHHSAPADPRKSPRTERGGRWGSHGVAHVLVTVIGIDMLRPPRRRGPRPRPTRPAVPAGPGSREREREHSRVSERDGLSRHRSPSFVLSVCPGAGVGGAATVLPPRAWVQWTRSRLPDEWTLLSPYPCRGSMAVGRTAAIALSSHLV